MLNTSAFFQHLKCCITIYVFCSRYPVISKPSVPSNTSSSRSRSSQSASASFAPALASAMHYRAHSRTIWWTHFDCVQCLGCRRRTARIDWLIYKRLDQASAPVDITISDSSIEQRRQQRLPARFTICAHTHTPLTFCTRVIEVTVGRFAKTVDECG